MLPFAHALSSGLETLKLIGGRWRVNRLLVVLWGLLALCWTACPSDGCKLTDRQAPGFGDRDGVFHVGPYLGHTTQTSVSVGWETLESGPTRLEYGPDVSYGQELSGPDGSMHQLVVEGLEPGALYHYRACSGDTCSIDLTFRTDPGPGQPIRFAVYGDCQDNPENHAKVAAQVEADEANLAVVVGDLVSDGQYREQYKERYLDPARRYSHYAPRYAAVGNHDRKDTEVVALIDYVMHPVDPAVPQAETSYSFTFGDAFFLVYDNTLDHYDFFFPLADIEPPLWLWLKERMASPEAQAATWRFAFAHYPPHTNCSEEGTEYAMPESAVAEYVLPLMREHGFQAHFAGHVHCYERLNFDGLLAITSGGGGGGLEPDERCDDGLPQAEKHACQHHHILVELGCDSARIWARNFDGQVIEELIMQADGSYELVP